MLLRFCLEWFKAVRRSKKGVELTVQLIVVMIILLALLVFLLIFFTGQSTKLTELWNSLVGGGIEEAEKMGGP